MVSGVAVQRDAVEDARPQPASAPAAAPRRIMDAPNVHDALSPFRFPLPVRPMAGPSETALLVCRCPEPNASLPAEKQCPVLNGESQRCGADGGGEVSILSDAKGRKQSRK